MQDQKIKLDKRIEAPAATFEISGTSGASRITDRIEAKDYGDAIIKFIQKYSLGKEPIFSLIAHKL